MKGKLKDLDPETAALHEGARQFHVKVGFAPVSMALVVHDSQTLLQYPMGALAQDQASFTLRHAIRGMILCGCIRAHV